MDIKVVFFGVLATILLSGSSGVFSIENSFADEDNLKVSTEDSEAYKKQLERAAKLGYTFYMGPELEYFYFKSDKSPEIFDTYTL